MLSILEPLFFRIAKGLMSRLRIFLYRLLGMKIGKRNRMESGRSRRLTQIAIGSGNAFTQGYMLWPEDAQYDGVRIKIGNNNYFNKNVMFDSCGVIEIGDYNLFGPDVYIADSNHTFGNQRSPKMLPMTRGFVRIGNHCWIGAKAVILKDVELGDYCVIAAGAVVTKSYPSGSVVAGVPAKVINRQ